MRSRWMKWIIGALVLMLASGLVGLNVSNAAPGNQPPDPAGPVRRAYWRALGIRTSELQIRVVDAITQQGIDGAGCVVGETGDRIETDAVGMAPIIDAPVFRHPRLEQMLAELHGALTILCYKNGYRDSINMGIRMYEGVTTQIAIWMYPIGPGDRRIEPTIYTQPVHRLWRIQLADKFRLYDQGEGPERPELSSPDPNLVAPQEPMGFEPQTPIERVPQPAPRMLVPQGPAPGPTPLVPPPLLPSEVPQPPRPPAPPAPGRR